MAASVKPTLVLVDAAALDEQLTLLHAKLDALLAARAAPPPALLDRAGLAGALDVSTKTLDRLRSEGLPELTIGDAPRFELERCLEWLRARGGGLRLVSAK